MKLLKKINSNQITTLTINNKNQSAYHLFVLIFKKQIKAKKFIKYLQKNHRLKHTLHSEYSP